MAVVLSQARRSRRFLAIGTRAHVLHAPETIVRATAQPFPVFVALRAGHVVTSVAREAIRRATAHARTKLVAFTRLVITLFAQLAVAVEPRGA